MNRRRFLKGVAATTLSVSLAGAVYGRTEAGWLTVTRQTLTVPNLPSPFAGKTFALLTDPHHGPFNSLSFLQAVVEQTNALQPDLIALCGDFIQGGDRGYIVPGLHVFAALRAPLGVFAVPGLSIFLIVSMGTLLPRHVRLSHIHVGSILDGWMFKVTHYMLRKMEQLPHEILYPRTHLNLAVRQAGRVHLTLQVIVQILVRVQLRLVIVAASPCGA